MDKNLVEKSQTLKRIKEIKQSMIVSLNVSVLYPPETKGSLEKMFFNLLEELIEKKINKISVTLD